jgi:hypothetical protein
MRCVVFLALLIATQTMPDLTFSFKRLKVRESAAFGRIAQAREFIQNSSLNRYTHGIFGEDIPFETSEKKGVKRYIVAPWSQVYTGMVTAHGGALYETLDMVGPYAAYFDVDIMPAPLNYRYTQFQVRLHRRVPTQLPYMALALALAIALAIALVCQ